MNNDSLEQEDIQLRLAIANGWIPVKLMSSLGLTPSSCPSVIMMNGVQWTLKDKHLKSAHYERAGVVEHIEGLR